MNRNSIILFKNNDDFIFNKNEDNFIICPLSELKENRLNLLVNEGANVNVLFINVKEEISLNIDVKDNATITLECLFDEEIKNIKINANVAKNAAINGYFADFSMKNVFADVSINLNDEYSKASIQVASLSCDKDDKKFEISLFHNAPNTFGNIDNYGVSKDDGKLLFSGVSHIKKGSKNSKTRQNAKIMVFDRYSNAIAKPILKIDENEIEASHAATVGKISDDELFYMTSRGLKEETAKELITLGYIKPIINRFKDEEIKDKILNLIERRM